MERALQPALLPPANRWACEPRPRATEPLISRPARPWISGAAGMLLAAVTAGADSRPAQAADCITEQPNVPPPEGTYWNPRWEINNYRRCWVLVDAAGHEVAAPVPAQPANPPVPAWRSFLGNLTGAGTPQPQAAPASPPTASPRKPHPSSQPDGPHRVVTTGQPARSEPPKSEVRPVKPNKSQPDQDALFEEFMRWRETQKLTGAK
jgi:hypothetical protein